MGCKKEHKKKQMDKAHVELMAKRFTEVTGQEVEVIVVMDENDSLYDFIPIEEDGLVTYMPKDLL